MASSNIPPWQELGSNCSISIMNNWDTSKWNSEIWFRASKAPLGIVSPCWSDLWAMHKAVRKAFKGVSSILTIQRSIVAQGGEGRLSRYRYKSLIKAQPRSHSLYLHKVMALHVRQNNHLQPLLLPTSNKVWYILLIHTMECLKIISNTKIKHLPVCIVKMLLSRLQRWMNTIHRDWERFPTKWTQTR